VVKGVVLSVTASFLFSGLYFLSTWLKPLTGFEIFGWRILLTLPCLMLFMSLSGEWTAVRAIFARVRAQPLLLLALFASAGLLGVQLWLFLWAPGAGSGLNVALGYFLLPLTMILTGRLVFGERLSRLQKVAGLLALFGVANQLLLVGGLAWETWLVALGYPVYFVLRRQLRMDGLASMWFDMLLMLPVAVYAAWGGGQLLAHFANAPDLYWLVPLMGLLSAWALVHYLLASRLLPMGLFGLLGYIEPVSMVGVALILGERIQPGEWLTYLPIWLAVLVLIAEGVRHLWRRGGPSARG
jgi:chloramphenicol-sensitive protein RarD